MVGILTFHDTTNFGSWLQTYALYKKVNDLGYDVQIIDYKCKEIVSREKVTIKKAGNYIRSNNYLVLCNVLFKQFFFKVYSHKYMRLSKKRYDRNNIRQANNLYDIFLIGSDLVWDARITNNDYTYLLDFAEKNKKKCAYAASLGYEILPGRITGIYKKYLDRFQYITVREKGAEKILNQLIDRRTVYEVCDPTLLLSKKEWMQFVKRKNEYGKYVLIYFGDNDNKLMRLAKRYAHKHKLKVVLLSSGEGFSEVNLAFPKTITDFISLIYYAEKVFTASYHGMMFSINFEKKLAYCNREPVSRMLSVSKKIGIEKYEINDSSFDVESEINYAEIRPKLQQFRKESLEHLKAML